MATETRPKTSSTEVADGLNHLIALAADLRSQVKQAHWTVVGPNFIALHHLFDDEAAILLAHVDLFAERVRALQSIPRGTVRAAAEQSPLDELPIEEIPEEEAVRAILERFEAYSEALGDGMDTTDAADDLATQDIYIEARRDVDLHAYFLRSHLPDGGRSRSRGR